MNNKISIIIPAYNTADVISRTLKSIEEQTYKNYEVIVVNDGSTDGTKEYLDNYKQHKDNVIVYHQHNQGVSVTRNKGLELATGEFVCFLDSDDTYHPTFLEKMLKRQQQKNANVVYCGYTAVHKAGVFKHCIISFHENRILPYFFDKDYFHFSAMLINKNFLEKNNIKFDESQRIGEDIFLLYRY